MKTLHNRLLQKLHTELGQNILSALKDPLLTDLYLNPDGKVWAITFHKKEVICEMKPEVADNLVRTVASSCDTIVNRESPRLSCDLGLDLDGAFSRFRFQGLIPPVVTDPAWSLRKPASKVFSLEDYENSKIITPAQRLVIEREVEKHNNILVVGGTGSGKTTLSNAILNHVSIRFPGERLIVIEDTRELKFDGPDTLFMVTTETVTMNDLVRDALRMNPDRIVVGEVRRGKETLELLKAWNTGHCGLATIHADTALRGLVRLEQLIQEIVNPVPEVIAETINLLVFITQAPNTKARRIVSEILFVEGYNRATRQYQTSKAQ